ncbi:MAG: GNAT family N-acetyltransferase [Bacteroidales bacterium]|nr:GNAT family N-acetyltransferase [Bacteroidales bacterium]MDD3962314.1 GNAT family N-acetyltransferase [Bacteroidales bacterium]MDY0286586.1 GNAT family N-acetyltransferase [Bacteroidales bacterium]
MTPSQFRHPKHNEWASFINHHPFGSPFQHPDCYELFWNFGKIKPAFLLHFDSDDYIDGVITAYPCSFLPDMSVFPYALISVNGPLAGPLSGLKEDTQSIQNNLLKSLADMKTLRSPLIELRQMNGLPISGSETGKSSKYLNLVKDISTKDIMLNTASVSRRRYIKKVIRDRFETDVVKKTSDLQEFLALLNKQYRGLKKPYISPEVIKGIANTSEGQDSFRVVVTKKENRVCGGAILGFSRDTCYEWYIVSDMTVKNSGTAVTYGAMEYAMTRGCKKFDFMGIGQAGVDYGVRDFKMGFGGDVVEYGRYRV